jgi:hypothetical protein
VRGIEDMQFATVRTRDDKFVGKVREFPDLKTRPQAKRLDAIDEIVRLTSERIREIHEAQHQAAT